MTAPLFAGIGDPLTKTCAGCRSVLPATRKFFQPRNDRAIGLTSRCRACLAVSDKARYVPTPRPSKTVDGLQTCTRCQLAKPATLGSFAPKPAMTNGLSSWCRDCQRAVAKERQAARRRHPTEREKLLDEKHRFATSPRGREYRRSASAVSNHGRRSRLLALPYRRTTDDWDQCKQDWDEKCAYCGGTYPLTQDHFIPLCDPMSPGTVPWNMLPACAPCNRSKGMRPPTTWCTSERLTAVLAYLNSKNASPAIGGGEWSAA